MFEVWGGMLKFQASLLNFFTESTNALVSVNPSNVITFLKDGNELVSTLELQNIDPNIHVSYKVSIYLI